jgi:hypothetical protein
MKFAANSLFVRVVSALAAAFLVFGSGYFGGRWGLFAINSLVIGLGVREYGRIAFARFDVPKFFLTLFAVACLGLYLSMLRWPEFGALALALGNS